MSVLIQNTQPFCLCDLMWSPHNGRTEEDTRKKIQYEPRDLNLKPDSASE